MLYLQYKHVLRVNKTDFNVDYLIKLHNYCMLRYILWDCSSLLAKLVVYLSQMKC